MQQEINKYFESPFIKVSMRFQTRTQCTKLPISNSRKIEKN